MQVLMYTIAYVRFALAKITSTLTQPFIDSSDSPD